MLTNNPIWVYYTYFVNIHTCTFDCAFNCNGKLIDFLIVRGIAVHNYIYRHSGGSPTDVILNERIYGSWCYCPVLLATE